MTKVIFKMEKDKPIAFFPDEPDDSNYGNCACYARIGQHMGACTGYASRLKPALPAQYEPLLRELQTIGYDDLKIVKRFTYKSKKIRQEKLQSS